MSRPGYSPVRLTNAHRPARPFACTPAAEPLNRHNPLVLGVVMSWAVPSSYFHVVTAHRYAGAAKLGHLRFNAIRQAENRPTGFGLPVVIDDGLTQLQKSNVRWARLGFTSQEQRFQTRQVASLIILSRTF